jgi:DNA-binding NtrC family response regulator
MAPSFTSNCPGLVPEAKPTIVLIDHDNAFRHALAENLRDDGFGVVEYADCSDLESTTTLERADALVHNVIESEDGLGFAARVHAEYPTLPIVVMTAYPTPQLEARIATIKYVALLRKPLSYTDLYEWLQQHFVRTNLATQIR